MLNVSTVVPFVDSEQTSKSVSCRLDITRSESRHGHQKMRTLTQPKTNDWTNIDAVLGQDDIIIGPINRNIIASTFLGKLEHA